MVMDELFGGAVELLKPLQCGDGTLSVMPSLTFFLGMGMLFYMVLRRGRQPIFRRISRDMIVQEVIFSWLINVTLKGWLLFLDTLDTLLMDHYVRQMRVWFPPKWRSSNPDLSSLPDPMQHMLHPLTLKMLLCTFMAVLPFVVIWKISREDNHMRNFMVWLGNHRWENTELGFGRNFVNRPARVFDPPAATLRAVAAMTRRSTGSLDADSYNEASDRQLHHGPRPRQRVTGPAALRASKSMH